jgi:hypothetical protein
LHFKRVKMSETPCIYILQKANNKNKNDNKT